MKNAVGYVGSFLLAAGFFTGPAWTAEETSKPVSERWRTITAHGAPVARHECAFVEAGGKFYLIGGRGRKPIDVYDPRTNTWTQASGPPTEIHHFQPVVYDGRIYVLGALTGGFPSETPVPNILIYDPRSDEWSRGPAIPEGRRRGAAGVVVHDGKIYLVDGIIDGHNGDYVNWLDEFNPRTGKWRKLPDAPRPRDHFQAAVVGGKLYAAGGRTSSHRTGQVLDLTIEEVDVFDFATGSWSTLAEPLPTDGAGTSTVAVGGRLIVLGGESAAQTAAHDELEAYNTKTGQWEKLPSLVRGRHGTGAIVYGGNIYTAAGSGNRGGGPELTSLEVLKAPSQ